MIVQAIIIKLKQKRFDVSIRTKEKFVHLKNNTSEPKGKKINVNVVVSGLQKWTITTQKFNFNY